MTQIKLIACWLNFKLIIEQINIIIFLQDEISNIINNNNNNKIKIHWDWSKQTKRSKKN
jgi:hypothetical protein